MSPLSVADTSVELWGVDVRDPYVWDGASSLWGGAGVVWGKGDVWNPVDCQVTQAAIKWGADDTAGVVVQSAAGQLLASTYDPDGLLDPANPSTPYRAMLAPGTPMRISYAGSPLRSGRLAGATYDRNEGTGRLEGRDAIAELAAAQTSATFRASTNSLRPFAEQVIAAASLSIPVEASPDGLEHVIAWREKTANQNVWGLIRDAAFDALHLAYVDPGGTLRFAPFGRPFDRGLVIGDGGICLEELETATDDAGTYTDVADAAGPIIVSGLPQPRMLKVDRREPEGIMWGLAIKSDRGAGAIQYEPTMIRPETVAELAQLVAVRGCDTVRLKLDTPPAIDVTGRVLGQGFRAPAGGHWSSSLTMYVAPEFWAVVPRSPSTVTGTPLSVDVPAAADTDVGLYWNTNYVPAKLSATGAGKQSQFAIQGGSPSSSATTQAKSRALIRFELPDPEVLFAGMRIYRSAKLRIYCQGVGAGMVALAVQRCVDPWVEGYGGAPLDFNQSGAIWPGPTLTSSGGVTGPPPAGAGWWEIDVTEIARTWLPRSLGGDALPNLGLCVFSTDEVANQGATFRSRENPNLTPPTLRINGEG